LTTLSGPIAVEQFRRQHIERRGWMVGGNNANFARAAEKREVRGRVFGIRGGEKDVCQLNRWGLVSGR